MTATTLAVRQGRSRKGTLRLDSKKTNLLLWSGLASAAAGILAVAAVARWQEHSHRNQRVAMRLRDIQGVLAACYDKINEIETHLPQKTRAIPAERASKTRTSVGSNGAPALDS